MRKLQMVAASELIDLINAKATQIGGGEVDNDEVRKVMENYKVSLWQAVAMAYLDIANCLIDGIRDVYLLRQQAIALEDLRNLKKVSESEGRSP